MRVADGVRCNSMVECLLMVRWVIGSIPHSGPTELFFLFQPCSMTGVTKAVGCAFILFFGGMNNILSGMVDIKETPCC